MKNFPTKKNVFLFSFFGALIFLSPVFFYGMLDCYNNDQLLCSRSYQSASMVFAPFLPLFLFSLITYKMREEVFLAWWNFARWWVPVIIVVTFLLNNTKGSGGGYLGLGQDFVMAILGILYSILVIFSLFKIIWQYAKMKDRANGEVD